MDRRPLLPEDLAPDPPLDTRNPAGGTVPWRKMSPPLRARAAGRRRVELRSRPSGGRAMKTLSEGEPDELELLQQLPGVNALHTGGFPGGLLRRGLRIAHFFPPLLYRTVTRDPQPHGAYRRAITIYPQVIDRPLITPSVMLGAGSTLSIPQMRGGI